MPPHCLRGQNPQSPARNRVAVPGARLHEISGLEVCTAPIVERLRLLQLQALSYLIANGDLHAKNISIQTTKGQTRQTPIYDLLSILPYGDGDLALPIEGRDKKLKRKHFLDFGEHIGIRPAATTRMLSTLLKGLAPHIVRPNSIGLATRKTTHLEKTITQRMRDLEPS